MTGPGTTWTNTRPTRWRGSSSGGEALVSTAGCSTRCRAGVLGHLPNWRDHGVMELTYRCHPFRDLISMPTFISA
jgi:hypothetical protein